MKISVLPIIIVEGKYDKIKLESLVDAVVVTTEGFGIFKDKHLQKNLRSLAMQNGAIILTDSDRAGFKIRKYLHDILSMATLYDLYIPDIYGKEKRKANPSAEGKLGVEGMSIDVLERLLTAFQNPPVKTGEEIRTIDLYELGLFGTANSCEKRRELQKSIGLPGALNKNMFLKILNRYYSKEQLMLFMNKK